MQRRENFKVGVIERDFVSCVASSSGGGVLWWSFPTRPQRQTQQHQFAMGVFSKWSTTRYLTTAFFDSSFNPIASTAVERLGLAAASPGLRSALSGV